MGRIKVNSMIPSKLFKSKCTIFSQKAFHYTIFKFWWMLICYLALSLSIFKIYNLSRIHQFIKLICQLLILHSLCSKLFFHLKLIFLEHFIYILLLFRFILIILAHSNFCLIFFIFNRNICIYRYPWIILARPFYRWIVFLLLIFTQSDHFKNVWT